MYPHNCIYYLNKSKNRGNRIAISSSTFDDQTLRAYVSCYVCLTVLSLVFIYMYDLMATPSIHFSCRSRTQREKHCKQGIFSNTGWP